MWGWDESDRKWSDAKTSWKTWKEYSHASADKYNASLRRKRRTRVDEGAHMAKLQHAIKKNKMVSVFPAIINSENIPLVPLGCFPRPCLTARRTRWSMTIFSILSGSLDLRLMLCRLSFHVLYIFVSLRIPHKTNRKHCKRHRTTINVSTACMQLPT